MENRNIRTVVIVGGGVAGWMSAAFLTHMLGSSTVVTLVEGDNLRGDNTACATLPPLKAFHQMLGINDADLIARCQGSMKLGTQFVNWGSLGNRYFHPHGTYGAQFDAVPLHQWWLKARGTQTSTPALDDLSMAWSMASQGRFSLPLPDRNLVQSTYDYAYHLDSDLYAGYLAALAKSFGAKDVKGDLANVVRDGDTGFVKHILLADGQIHEADLFIDCSGAGTLLSHEAPNSHFEDWSAYLPCNSIASVSCVKANEFNAYTRATARDAGWQWRIPLQNRTSMGYVFASEHLSNDDAIASLMDNLDNRALGEASIATFTNGRRHQAFAKNVVAIGDAAGFLEPLESTRVTMIHSALSRLLALWPTRDCDPVTVGEYNRITATEWDLARDFLVLHYKATSRKDTPLWRACGAAQIPDSLQTRLEHWRSSGRLVSPQPEVFQSASWLAVLVGQEQIPDRWDPLADARADRVDYQARLEGLARVISQTAAQMQTHQDWIDKNARGDRR